MNNKLNQKPPKTFTSPTTWFFVLDDDNEFVLRYFKSVASKDKINPNKGHIGMMICDIKITDYIDDDFLYIFGSIKSVKGNY